MSQQPQQKPLPSSIPTVGPIAPPGIVPGAGKIILPAGPPNTSNAPSAPMPAIVATPNVASGVPGPGQGATAASQAPTQPATFIPPGGLPPPPGSPAGGGGNQPGGNQPPPGVAAVDPDAGRKYRGWFPRWWLLSAFFCSLLIGIISLLLSTTCTARSGSWLCQASGWTDIRQEIPVAAGWILFLLGWVVAYVFGVVYIEVDRHERSRIAHFLRTITEFETTYTMLYIYAGIAFWILVLMWYFNRIQTAALLICSFVIFVGGSCFLYTRRQSPVEQRTWLMGASIFSLFCMLVMFFIGPFNLPLFTAEVLVIVVAVWNFIRRRPNAQPQNPVQAQAMLRAATRTPRAVFLALLRSLIHP